MEIPDPQCVIQFTKQFVAHLVSTVLTLSEDYYGSERSEFLGNNTPKSTTKDPNESGDGDGTTTTTAAPRKVSIHSRGFAGVLIQFALELCQSFEFQLVTLSAGSAEDDIEPLDVAHFVAHQVTDNLFGTYDYKSVSAEIILSLLLRSNFDSDEGLVFGRTKRIQQAFQDTGILELRKAGERSYLVRRGQAHSQHHFRLKLKHEKLEGLVAAGEYEVVANTERLLQDLPEEFKSYSYQLTDNWRIPLIMEELTRECMKELDVQEADLNENGGGGGLEVEVAMAVVNCPVKQYRVALEKEARVEYENEELISKQIGEKTRRSGATQGGNPLGASLMMMGMPKSENNSWRFEIKRQKSDV